MQWASVSKNRCNLYRSLNAIVAQSANSLIGVRIARSKRDGTCAETRFGLSAKQTGPFKSAGVSVQSTAGSRGVRISADSDCIDRVPTYSARLLATHSIRIFPLHFPSRASRCAIRF